MRNRTLQMLLGGAFIAAAALAGAADAAPDPPLKRPPVFTPPDVWWSHTNQDRFDPVSNPSHTNQDEVKPPKDPPLPPPDGAQGPDKGTRRLLEIDVLGDGIFEDPIDADVSEMASAPAPPSLDPPARQNDWLLVADDPFATGSGDVPGVAPIPGPGVLPVLGLAALATGRRRRRRG